MEKLYETIISVKKGTAAPEEADTALWENIIACQGMSFYTSSGLPFCYTVKRNRAGEYSGELIVNRKEDSKTLTKSSVMFAFHKVLGAIALTGNDAEFARESTIGSAGKNIARSAGESIVESKAGNAVESRIENPVGSRTGSTAGSKTENTIVLPEYKGPKAIGQIFGISYIYSMFWRFGLIAVPDRVADKLGNQED